MLQLRLPKLGLIGDAILPIGAAKSLGAGFREGRGPLVHNLRFTTATTELDHISCVQTPAAHMQSYSLAAAVLVAHLEQGDKFAVHIFWLGLSVSVSSSGDNDWACKEQIKRRSS